MLQLLWRLGNLPDTFDDTEMLHCFNVPICVVVMTSFHEVIPELCIKTPVRNSARLPDPMHVAHAIACSAPCIAVDDGL